ncbi:MAG: DUF1003 domain-containing protein [Actinobacteria bacterium]|nr:DUF1003 domain-containing protein [Actinomycetota bacterium]
MEKTTENNNNKKCSICHKLLASNQLVSPETITRPILEFIKNKNPEWSPESPVCLNCLSLLGSEYVTKVLEEEKGEISALDQEVIQSLKDQEILSENINKEFDEKLTFGQRAADKVADFGGSWIFIGIFAFILVTWIIINSVAILLRPFDPFPYILLNLCLSCLAAIQAPIIMMSQNRQEAKDRLRSEHDYRVNLKAELEIRHLQEKIDLLLKHQWQKLLEIQQIQISLLEELAQDKKEIEKK